MKLSACVITTFAASMIVALVGCRSLPATADSDRPSASALAVGPGPTNYTVQPQPAPGACHYRYTDSGQPLPDAKCTPGAINPKVTQGNIEQTICRSGYTKSIRPPHAVTNIEKRLNAKAYGYTGNLRYAELDHLVALSIGGDPNSALNLWVEPPSPGHKPKDGVNNDKDKTEATLHSLVCSRRISLVDAQMRMATDWTTATGGLK